MWHFGVNSTSCVLIAVNVNRAQDFAETRKHEQEMERQVMQNVRRMAHDTMSEKRDVCRVCCDSCYSVPVYVYICQFLPNSLCLLMYSLFLHSWLMTKEGVWLTKGSAVDSPQLLFLWETWHVTK